MDKNVIKKYAVWARRELIERVSQRAMIYGITVKDAGDPNAESVNGHLLSQAEKRQRQALIRNIKIKGYEQVIEEVAYTWFNRFAALRFMEVNGYLPSHVRVFTNDAGDFKPQILAEAIHLEIDGLDMNKVYELENANKSEELFKYLLIVQCNALNSILPEMFQRIEDYTELLLPDYLLREGSVIEQMVSTIPEENWTDQVQIIGWLYQYYNTEPKDKVFADLKKNIKITKENIPAATQLFTPDWIVHYMVENSLGRLWLEGHPNDALKSEWKYYLDEADQEEEVQAQLATIRKEHAALKPEEIRVIDPCMGSGHILCVLFDVLVRIYEDYGYTAREAAVKIVENNLWGLDIDKRATQLSYFAVMMKARQYDRRFFTRKVQPHVYAIEESNDITSASLHGLGLHLTQEEYREAVKETMLLFNEMHDAKEYGSIIHITPCNWDFLRRFAVLKEGEGQLHLDIHGEIEVSEKLQKLINIGEALSQKYHVAVTNPPYMGAKGMTEKLSIFLNENYVIGKTDLFSAFIIRVKELTKKNGYIGMLTPFVWMSILSYKQLRKEIIDTAKITSLIQLEYNAFPEACVPVCTFTLCNSDFPIENGSYIKLSDFKGAQMQKPKALEAIHSRECPYRYSTTTKAFSDVPGFRIAYWASPNNIAAYNRFRPLSDVADVRKGMSTADDKRFLRLWYEVSVVKFDAFNTDNPKWYRLNKGGPLRRWYGNNNYVVNWENNGREMKAFKKAVIRNEGYYYRENGLTWTYITNYKLNVRFYEKALFSAAGPCIFPNELPWQYVLGYLNSNVAQEFADNTGGETMTYEVGEISTIPIAKPSSSYIDRIIAIVNECVDISRKDWDSFETSWDFKRHPLLQYGDHLISNAYEKYKAECNKRFEVLKRKEEELNTLFAEIYNMNDELSCEVSNRDITVHSIFECNEQIPEDYSGNIYTLTKRDIVVSLISYAVGCMFGRYSLDKDGLCFAGGDWKAALYQSFIPDSDGIIPVCDDEYFADDIVGKFIEFIRIAFGDKSFSENLKFISDSLGGKGTPVKVIRKYFLDQFYQDHCSTYSIVGSGQRPIYWMFDSGRKNGFKCLIYMHRYQPDTIARIRTDYVHEQQSRYRTAIADMEQRINGVSTSERVRISKKLTTLKAQDMEIRAYEEKIHHLADQMIKIDLDNGMKKNYEIFKDVLAKIK